MARVGSQAFIAGAGSQAFTGAILVAFMAGVSGTFTAIVFSAVIVSSFPVSMGTRGGGIGVILIIGVTHIIRIIRITLTSSQITQDRYHRYDVYYDDPYYRTGGVRSCPRISFTLKA